MDRLDALQDEARALNGAGRPRLLRQRELYLHQRLARGGWPRARSQGFYKTPVAEGASINLGAMLRLQPDNVRSAPAVGVAMAQFRMKF